MKSRAFTLIELLVVIAIIAILAAILFPVFSRAKESAKATQAMVQMRQLSTAVWLYLSDYDDKFVPATIYPASGDREIWPPKVLPYAGGKGVFVVGGTNAGFAEGWSTRNQTNVGLNGATAVDFTADGCVEGQPDTAGCEGFTTPASFSQAEDASSTALFTTTPHGPLANKYRGYVFSPYNGPENLDDIRKSIPLTSDRDLVAELGATLPPSRLKPVRMLFFADGRNGGRSPVIFADGHAKSISANQVLAMDKIIWRFR